MHEHSQGRRHAQELDALVALGKASKSMDELEAVKGKGSSVSAEQLNFDVRIPKTEPGLHEAVCLTHKPRESSEAPQMCYELPASCFDAGENELLSDISSSISFDSGPLPADVIRRASSTGPQSAVHTTAPNPAIKPTLGLSMPLLLGLLSALMALLFLGLWLLD